MSWLSGAISSFAGGVPGLALNAVGGVINNALAMGRQKQAQGFEADMYGSRYQRQVADIKAAGLNPMLAYMQSPGAAPSSGIASSQGVDLSDSYNQRKLASASEAKMRVEASNVVSQTSKNIAEIKVAEAQQRNIDADTTYKLGLPPLVAAQVVQAQSSAAQSDALVKKIEAEIPNVVEELREIRSRVDKNRSDIKLNESLVKANEYLNSLRIAEALLKGEEKKVAGMRAWQLASTTGRMGLQAENLGKIGQNIWKWIFPTIGGP